MSDSGLFTTRYAPAKLEDYLGNEEKLAGVKNWMLQWLSNKPRKPLLIWGPPGVGKTSLAYTLAKEYDFDVIELNASELRNKNRVEKVLGGASLASSLFGRGRIVLIDDADVLSGRSDYGGSGAIIAFLREAPCPIIITATDAWDKKLSTLRSECELVELKKIGRMTIKKHLEYVVEAEKFGMDPKLIETIAEGAGGDVRAALNDLQARVVGTRDKDKDIFDLVRTIFKAEKYADVKQALRGDIDYDLIKLWIDENIPYEYESYADIAAAYDSLSKADIFDGRIRKTNWQYMKYSIDLATAGVSLAKLAPYRKFTKYNFPTYLRAMSQTMAIRTMKKSLGLKLGAKLHTNRRDALNFIQILKEQAKLDSDWVARHYQLEEEELAYVLGTSVSRVKKAG